jgi:hypothetical protein
MIDRIGFLIGATVAVYVLTLIFRVFIKWLSQKTTIGSWVSEDTVASILAAMTGFLATYRRMGSEATMYLVGGIIVWSILRFGDRPIFTKRTK